MNEARYGSPDLTARRKRAGYVALATHLAGAIVPGVIMITTEGPSAGSDASLNLTLAKGQIGLLALVWLGQALALANWIWLAAAEQRGRRSGPRLSLNARTDRAAVQVCLAAIMAASWAAEIGYLPQANYQISSGGFGEEVSGFTIGMLVLFVVVAFAAGLTLLFALAGARAAQRPAPPPGDPAALRRARTVALRWAWISGALAVALVALSAVALATGHFNAHFATMAPVLVLINVARVVQCLIVARAARRGQSPPVHAAP